MLLKSDWQECELIKLETFSKIRKQAQELIVCELCVFALKKIYERDNIVLYKEDRCRNKQYVTRNAK